ncbi:diacylglycerol/lipid kinase family protein [Microlunatus capsulatus]|uniref:Diacylglycerol kinase family enzyme n=1 Tax=Microlunatus capsulatus TaxID=99117 RepID=A0ABS4Z8H4_9ACTN|nr:diacylglycerol kinase family protein [Microlunatus capsulatus]MBP2417075.1 diacylglycerol kinase family enzyme [Microlunatus capsulatus]
MPDVSSDATRCAVVCNPTKVSDGFRALVTERTEAVGWAPPLWLETSEDDPGRGMTREALAAGVDVVLAAGGDGTIRVVADAMAGSGTTMAVIPAGTGNLLARNLDLPLEEAGALEVALAGRTRAIDLVALAVDGGPEEHFAVMAGVGVDATIMDEVDPALKKKVGPAAYFVAAGKALGRLPIPMEVSVDGGRRHRRRAMTCLIGNVGKLPGGLVLMPDAQADDGRLDVYVASPLRVSHWLKLALRVITRRGQRDDQVDSWQGGRVELTLRRAEAYQLDGDVVGEGRRLVAEVRRGALTVCVP